MILNLNNIEDLLLKNIGILNKLPKYSALFHQWKLGQIVSVFKSSGQKAKLELLNSLTDDDLEIIKDHLKLKSLKVEKIDYESVKDLKTDIKNASQFFNNTNIDNFCITRQNDQLYICSWR